MSRRFYSGDQVTIEFMKDFDRLCGSRTRWQVWSDWVHLAAYSISNTVDEIHAKEREKSYLKIASGYSKSELELVSHLLGYTVEALELNPDQDFLGELYMNLDLGNSHAGQFFTPYCVSKMMAMMNFNSEGLNIPSNRNYATVCDPTVGGGGMLVAFANACKAHKIYYHTDIMFIGQDIDHTVACMAYIQISLLGCPGYIVVGNSLTEPTTGDPIFAPMERETFITPFYCSEIWTWRRMFRSLFGVSTAETRGESDSRSDNIETCSDEENAAEPVATNETHEETHACVSKLETNTSSSVNEQEHYLQLSFF